MNQRFLLAYLSSVWSLAMLIEAKMPDKEKYLFQIETIFKWHVFIHFFCLKKINAEY